MLLLQTPPPTTVQIGGTEFSINTDFRVMISYERLMKNESNADDKKVVMAMLLFYGNVLPKDLAAGYGELLHFYRCGKSAEEIARENNILSGSTSGEITYDFDQDWQYLYAAFRDQYGIDLKESETPYLHWWEFRSCFVGLKHDCEICKIMGYRAIKINQKMSKEEKSFYKRMKELYKVQNQGAPRKMTLKERNEAMKARARRAMMETRHTKEQREGK